MVVGDSLEKEDINLVIGVVLVRTDSFQVVDNFLTGNQPQKVGSGRIATFRKLKVMTTSHQQNETHFILRFELRKYKNEAYEVTDEVNSSPICVLSHSTQMKNNGKDEMTTTSSTSTTSTGNHPTMIETLDLENLPSVSEVIPPIGPTSGGTRVAIIGSRFSDNPTTRIRFGTTDVMATFHSSGALVCHTPEHINGIVEVRVCNLKDQYSFTFAQFKYDDVVSKEIKRTGQLSNTETRSIVSHSGSADENSFANWRSELDAVKKVH